MDGEFPTDATLPASGEDAAAREDSGNPAIEAASFEYLGQWNRLVSTTNWEKGRIIAAWREALIETGAPAASYTDEAWSRCVGNITPQHTGRLRRVYQRFHSTREIYRGLYWSHYQAALDWDDAEMWLVGAVQNNWSISQMQGERSRTLGSLPTAPQDLAQDEVDEDSTAVAPHLPPAVVSDSVVDVSPVDSSDTGEHAHSDDSSQDAPFDAADAYAAEDPAPFRPFENLPTLPADLQNAFEAFKVAIVHHRLAGWAEISKEDVLGTLEALRQLALAEA